MQDLASATRASASASGASASAWLRSLGFGYALAAYLGFFVVYGMFVVRNMGYAEALGLDLGPSFEAPALAVLFDTGLVLLFGAQHSLMARAAFKRQLTRFVPQALERATFMWASNVTLAAVALLWAPIPGTVWTLTQPLLAWSLWLIGLLGWAGVAGASFLIDHFELFGLRQAWSWLRARPMPSQAFRTPGAYRTVRHPMMLALLVGLWSTPSMSVVRLLLAVSMTAYLLAGVSFEERDLVRVFGKRYLDYQASVPRLLPRVFARRAPANDLPAAGVSVVTEAPARQREGAKA